MMVPISYLLIPISIMMLFWIALLYDHYMYRKHLEKCLNLSGKKKKKKEIKLYNSNYPFGGGIPINPMEEELEKKIKESKENAYAKKG